MKKKLIEKLKDTFHPNRMTASGLLMNGAAIAMMSDPDTAPYGFGLLSVSYLTDGLDGYFARRWNRKTKVGAMLDPLVDKGKFLIAMGAASSIEFTSGNYFLPMAVLANLVVDGISQRQRGDLLKQIDDAYDGIISPELCEKDEEVRSATRANWHGKAKTGIQTAETLVYWGYHTASHYTEEITWCEDNLGYILGGALIVSAVLGTIGLAKRMGNKKGLEEKIVADLKD